MTSRDKCMLKYPFITFKFVRICLSFVQISMRDRCNNMVIKQFIFQENKFVVFPDNRTHFQLVYRFRTEI
jgi:hypothetical protein